MTLLLVGAGGHAKAIVEALRLAGKEITHYADPEPRTWIDANHVPDDDTARDLPKGEVVIGLGGTTAGALTTRLALLDSYLAAGWAATPVQHPAATVSGTATLGAGSIVLAGAIVQPGAELGRGVIVNTGAIVEHDSAVGDGAHIGPGAILLGDCEIGPAAMVGAGAVLLPGAALPGGGLAPAANRYPA